MSDRLQERMPAPVLGLELAARQQPGPAHIPLYSADAGQAMAGRGRRALMLAVCCMSLFIYRANVSPGSVAQTTEAFMGVSPFPLVLKLG